MKRWTKRTRSMLTMAAALIATALLAIYALTPNVPIYRAIEGRPLLEQNGPVFVDAQLGLRFTPPAGWAMQARSTEAPGEHRPERMVVKYKRLVPGPKEAWLRVSVSDAPANTSPAELLRLLKPRE